MRAQYGGQVHRGHGQRLLGFGVKAFALEFEARLARALIEIKRIDPNPRLATQAAPQAIGLQQIEIAADLADDDRFALIAVGDRRLGMQP